MNFRKEGFCGEEDHTGRGKPSDQYLSSAPASASSYHQTQQLQPIPIPRFHQISPWLTGGEDTEEDPARRSGTSDASSIGRCIEKEQMFDKVVTPSDVGKLNRLVIPKQHAEKYFPLDSSSNEKGLLLNFEDRNGKPWRFRYSYWNSSQSYVMTKGWSRFVKEKKLDAGDIVSFQRGAGESGRDRLYIDWRRRPTILPDLHLHHLPLSTSPWLFPPHQNNFNNNSLIFNRSSVNYHGNVVGPLGGSVIYLRRGVADPQAHNQEVGMGTMVYDSVPVVHGKIAAKRLRLFGVNMDCPIPDDSDAHQDTLSSPSTVASTSALPHATLVPQPIQLSSSAQRPSHLRLFNGTPLPQAAHDFLNKGKSSSSSLDLDLDLDL